MSGTNEAAAPSWLDEDLLTTLLLADDPATQIKILSFSAKSAVPAGNNYVCIVLRINVEYERNGKLAHKSLIVKKPLADGKAKEMIEKLGLIDKECTIYNELVPIMNKMTNKTITPKNYVCPIPEIIILEDLSEQGYVMCDRIQQLDFDHCNAFMKVIGSFHSLSVHIQNQEPELMKKIGKETFYREDISPEERKIMCKPLKTLASVLKEWEGFERFSNFVKSVENIMWDKVVEAHNGKKHLRVLNHGDAWTSNMLFKHNDAGKVVDMKLIDLQLCKLASPAVDLIHFLTASAQEDVKEHRLAELYATYLDSFNSTLEALGSEERLSQERLQDEIKFVEDLGLPLFLLTHQVAAALCEKENLLNMEELMEKIASPDENDHTYKMLNGKYFKKVAKYTLKKLEENGFFQSY